MVSETRQTAPYAPVANVLTVIRRFRERGLLDPLTLQELERIGIPTGNAPRTLAALRFLGLVDDEGHRMDAFERLHGASTADYPKVLAEIVREAYEPVFTVVDPAEDTEIQLHDAFRHYQPQAQRERMVTLFLGLCQEAGIVQGGPPERRPRARRATLTARQPTTVSTKEAYEEASPSADVGGADYRLLSALIQQLPRPGTGWTKVRRDKWMQAMGSAIDLLFPTAGELDRTE